MNNILETITSNQLKEVPNAEQIVNYLNMNLSTAIDKEMYLTELEENVKAFKNTLEDMMHLLRQHPLHRLNKINQSTFYSLEETVNLLNLDRQKIIRMIKKGKIAAVRDGKKYLPYKWSVDKFIYSYTMTTLPQPGTASSTSLEVLNKKRVYHPANNFSLEVFKQSRI